MSSCLAIFHAEHTALSTAGVVFSVCTLRSVTLTDLLALLERSSGSGIVSDIDIEAIRCVLGSCTTLALVGKGFTGVSLRYCTRSHRAPLLAHRKLIIEYDPVICLSAPTASETASSVCLQTTASARKGRWHWRLRSKEIAH